MKQRSIFVLGVRAVVIHNGVKHEVVATDISNYEAEHSFPCEFDCGVFLQ